MKKDKKAVLPDIKATTGKTPFPENRTVLFPVVLSLSFLINFILYALTLAPTVTFEDSGELIAAAYNLGVPHEPGYPLFTILGKLFTLLPFGTIACRVNLMSAFFTALAAVWVCWATILIIQKTFLKTRFWKNASESTRNALTYSAGLCSAVLFGTSFEAWEQAIITEVYGLNSFFVSLFILLIVLWTRATDIKVKKSFFLFICFVLGLTLTNHTTSAMLIPLFCVYILLTDRHLFREYALIIKSSLFFLLGLTPFLYLPFSSMRDPVIDWGNPENLTNFIRTITRHQYQSPAAQTLSGFLSQFQVCVTELLTMQWYPIMLILSVIGLLVLFRYHKSFFIFSLAFLFFALPVTTFMTNFDVTSPLVAFEHKALVSVFYIPAYLFLAILMGIGIFYLLSLIKTSPFFYFSIAFCLPILMAAGDIMKNYSRLNMHDYYFARDYAENIFNTLPPNSILFVNWDLFSFPLYYYQYVEQKRRDILVIDQMLLKRSWYILSLGIHYPDVMRQAEGQENAFLRAVAPFEDNAPYDGQMIQRNYIALINAIIDGSLTRGNAVFFTYTPEPDIMRNNHLEPQLSAYRYTNSTLPDTTLNESVLKLDLFSDTKIHRDRMASYVRGYYGNLCGTRAMLLESAGYRQKAKEWYLKARMFFDSGTQQALFINAKIAAL